MTTDSQREYKIIGGDDVEYGPISLAELKEWIRDGRVAGGTEVWRSDLGRWSSADRYTELHEALLHLHTSAEMANDRMARPAGFWVRFAAYMIDYAMLTILFMALWIPLSDAQHWPVVPALPKDRSDAEIHQFMERRNVWIGRALPVFYPIFILYEVLLNGRFGATLGKMAVGAKIIRLDGSPLGYNRALLRWFAERLSAFALFTGYFLIAIRADKRGLHDLLAGTRVIYKR